VSINNLNDFRSAYTTATYWWEPQDRPVIWACTKEMPNHSNVNEVFAKVSLVNRLYRANLHMGAKSAEWKVAETLVNERFDMSLSALRALSAFDPASLPTVLDAHECLVKIARSVTERTENSFAAKYLSFHFPAVVPIFDNNAYATGWKLVGRRLSSELYTNRLNCDYGYHCEAILLLVDHLKEHGVNEPNLKLIDNVLYDSSW
jgi:hypothetical protein